MSLANLKATTEYQEAIQATEDIKPPSVGFAKTADYKGGLANQVNAVIKQNNTLLYLASKQSQKLIELEEKFDRLKQKVNTVIEKEIQPTNLEDSISSLAKRLDNFSISELPTQEDQIRGYRQMARNRHQVARTTRKVFERNNYNRTLKTAVDPERQLEISRERRANLVPAEILYSNNRSIARHRVYEHYSEQRVLLHALHRRSAGTNALVVLRDTRWEDNRQIIATMEVDLSAGTQLVYTFPDMILSVNDFHNHVEVAIQTHGYDTWQGGESNLLITMALTGRLSNTSYMGFQYSVENVVDHLTTNGITAIPSERRSIEELEGMSWNLKPPEQTSVHVPSRVAVNERLNRSVSLRFERYRQTLRPPRYSVDQHDREVIGNDNLDEDEEHFVGIFSQTPQIEHTPYDICFCEDCLNEDDQFATQKQRSELEWENPFAAKRAQIVKRHEEHTFPTAADDAESSTSYQPPPDAIMGPIVYPPARQNPQQTYRPDYQFGYPQGKGNTFYGGYDPGLWSDVISKWESITINRLNSQTWSDNKAKLAFVEKLLGESEKVMWQQWRTAYPGAYSALETIADDPQNITSQVRQLIIMEDPYGGSTDEQDRAYRDLDRITCEETKNLWSFLADFKQLAIKSGKLYFPSTTEKLFAKLPPSLSKKIEESFKARHPGLSAGVLPAIKFTHTFVSEMCKDAALAKELRDLSLCSAIPILESIRTTEEESRSVSASFVERKDIL
nr:hypothetical protein AMTR_s00071p00160380 [Tanacetum cinerariifolium]